MQHMTPEATCSAMPVRELHRYLDQAPGPPCRQIRRGRASGGQSHGKPRREVIGCVPANAWKSEPAHARNQPHTV